MPDCLNPALFSGPSKVKLNPDMMKKLFFLPVLLLIAISLQSQNPRDTLQIDEVVVTGSRIEVTRNSMPVNISVISRQVLNDAEESAALPVLSRRIPGMFVTERGVTGLSVGSSSAGQITIRGVGSAPNTQVLVLVDGQPQYMGLFGHPLPNSFVASDLERVEVIRGPASILYGSNAMGGVVNFITRNQKEEGFSGNVRAAYGSFNTFKIMANSGYRNDRMFAFVSLNRDYTDGHRDHSSFEINNGFLRAGMNITPQLEISADVMYTVFNNVDPGPEFNLNPFIADIERSRASVALKNDYGVTKGGLLFFHNQGQNNLSSGWISDDELYGVNLYQGINLPFNSIFTIGGDYRRAAGRGNSGVAANQWLTLNEKAVYGIMRHQLPARVHLHYGLRLENNELFGNVTVPQAGVSWQALQATFIKASVSGGFRSPALSELFLFMPNPELQPERLTAYEAGISHHFLKGKLQTELTLFLLEGSDMIRIVPNPAPPPPMRRINTGEFTNHGFELEANYNHNSVFSAEISYSYLQTELPLLAAPRHQLFAGGNFRFNRFRTSINGHYVGGLYTYIHNPQQGQNTSNDVVENYFLLNANISARVWGPIEVFISAKNILNQLYSINQGYPMPGFHMMSGLNMSF
jgi:outer membrane cobalamin receptor